MMEEAKSILSSVKEAFFGNDETREQLMEVKKDIVKEYINTLKKDNPIIDDIEEPLEKYLINDGSVEDVFQDIFRGCWLSLLLPESIDNLRKVRDRISSMQKIPTTEELATLKSEISSVQVQVNPEMTEQTGESQPQRAIQTSSVTTGASQKLSYSLETGSEISEQESKFVNSVYKRAAQLVGTRYKFGGKNPSTGIDCSGLWQRVFTQEGIKFSGCLNAHAFSDADVDIKKDQVKPGDFMFWDQKPGTKKHNSIYHIEMVVSKPYTKNGKTYVRTLGSSTDARDDCGNYVGNGVQFREREMKDYRHYGRPTYYYQLAQHEKTGSSDNLRAGASKPSSNLSEKVLNS